VTGGEVKADQVVLKASRLATSYPRTIEEVYQNGMAFTLRYDFCSRFAERQFVSFGSGLQHAKPRFLGELGLQIYRGRKGDQLYDPSDAVPCS